MPEIPRDTLIWSLPVVPESSPLYSSQVLRFFMLGGLVLFAGAGLVGLVTGSTQALFQAGPLVLELLAWLYLLILVAALTVQSNARMTLLMRPFASRGRRCACRPPRPAGEEGSPGPTSGSPPSP